jgi:NADH:ubiquinone oxidoreductase subunit 3 (subunit A)
MKPIKDTKLGHWLKDNFPKVLDTVGEVLPDKGVLGIVKNLIDREDIAPEQRAAAMATLHALEKEMVALEMADRASAREREASINQSEHASWLAKNTASIIALSYTLFNFIIYVMILSGSIRVNENMAILIVNSITNIAMLIVGYYYGASDKRGMKSFYAEEKRKAA